MSLDSDLHELVEGMASLDFSDSRFDTALLDLTLGKLMQMLYEGLTFLKDPDHCEECSTMMHSLVDSVTRITLEIQTREKAESVVP